MTKAEDHVLMSCYLTVLVTCKQCYAMELPDGLDSSSLFEFFFAQTLLS